MVRCEVKVQQAIEPRFNYHIVNSVFLQRFYFFPTLMSRPRCSISLVHWVKIGGTSVWVRCNKVIMSTPKVFGWLLMAGHSVWRISRHFLWAERPHCQSHQTVSSTSLKLEKVLHQCISYMTRYFNSSYELLIVLQNRKELSSKSALG